MRPVSERNFGLLIAYLVPGFVVLWGLSYFSETVRFWLAAPPVGSSIVGGFLYVTLGSVAAGLTVSAIRWLVLDTIHHRTGLRQPDWDFSRLQAHLGAFENHYRYYQFYGNMLVVMLVAAVARRPFTGLLPAEPGVGAVVVFGLAVLFFVASRDALRKYYARTSMLLGSRKTGKEITDDERMASQGQYKETSRGEEAGQRQAKEGG